MNDLLLVIVVGLVIVGVLFVLRSRDAGEARVSESAAPRARKLMAQPVDPMVLSLVVGLLGRSRKVQAVKELMRATGLGMAEAKALAEAIQTGHRPPAVIRGEAVDVEQPGRGNAAPGPRGLAERARDLRGQGREVEAVRLVCEETGMGIADAQKFVRAL